MFERLRAANPHPTTELEYASAFELLIAVILSAQATDRGVNIATRKLFPVANTPQALLALGEDGLLPYIRTIGLYKNKGKNIIATCRLLIEQHDGDVPRERDALEALPGVGRKTANVVLNTAFGEPTMAVDTHIFRVANRTGLAPRQDRARRREEATQERSRGILAGCPSLADPAWSLRLQGPQTQLPRLPDRRSVQLSTQNPRRLTRKYPAHVL